MDGSIAVSVYWPCQLCLYPSPTRSCCKDWTHTSAAKEKLSSRKDQWKRLSDELCCGTIFIECYDHQRGWWNLIAAFFSSCDRYPFGVREWVREICHWSAFYRWHSCRATGIRQLEGHRRSLNLSRFICTRMEGSISNGNCTRTTSRHWRGEKSSSNHCCIWGQRTITCKLWHYVRRKWICSLLICLFFFFFLVKWRTQIVGPGVKTLSFASNYLITHRHCLLRVDLVIWR